MKKLPLLAMFLFVSLILTACSMRQDEDQLLSTEPNENDPVNESVTIDNDIPSISIEKIEEYEGVEMTDWLNEHTVVLSKENTELEKMTLLEKADVYPRSIYLYNMDTKEYKTIKAQKDLFLGGAKLSPDKKHLLFYEYSIGDVAYYLMSLDSGTQSLVTEDILGIGYTAEWTDDQQVIGASYAGGVNLAKVNKEITPIPELSEEQIFTVQKTQSNVFYITSDGPSFQLYKLDMDTKEKKNLNVENAVGITPSPDGGQLLITQGTESTKTLLLSDVEGNSLKTIAEGSDVTGVSWSPNQKMIAYQLKTSDNSGIYLYDVLTDKSVQILDTENDGSAGISWSPSGEKMAVSVLNQRKYNSNVIYLK